MNGNSHLSPTSVGSPGPSREKVWEPDPTSARGLETGVLGLVLVLRAKLAMVRHLVTYHRKTMSRNRDNFGLK